MRRQSLRQTMPSHLRSARAARKSGFTLSPFRPINLKQMAGLENSRLFESLDESELRVLRECSEEREFQAGQQIFQEGEVGDGLYLIKEGVVQLAVMVNLM